MRASSTLLALVCSSLHTVGARHALLAAWAVHPGRCSTGSRQPRASPLTEAFTPRTRSASADGALRRRSLLSLSPTDSEKTAASGKSLFIFGVGYVATAIALTFLRKGWTVHGTCTDPRKVKSLGDQGIKTYIFDDWSGPMMQPEPLDALATATCILSTVPPALQSGADPVLVAHDAELKWAHRNGSLRWVGYLSSTGVYGDRGGGWVTEEDEPWPAAPRTKARLTAERSWLRLHARDGLPVHVFRLAGIYGPGRSALDAVARHSGDIRLAGSDDGTMVSRIHAADIVGVVEASIEQPEAGMVMNVADDLPSTRYEVCWDRYRSAETLVHGKELTLESVVGLETLAYGCKLLGYPRQDPDPSEKYVNRRGGGNKRVDNRKMRALLEASGRPLVFPDYRVGLRALHEGDGRPFSQPSDASLTTAGGTASTDDTRSSSPGVAAELRALSLKVSSLEAKLGRVLAFLDEKAGLTGAAGRGRTDGGSGMGTGDSEGVDVVEGVISSAGGTNESSEGEVERVEGGPEVVVPLAVDVGRDGSGEADQTAAEVVKG